MAARAVVPVTVFEVSAIGPDSTDSAPPMDPPVNAAGAEAEAAELPRDNVQFPPFNWTCTLEELTNWHYPCLKTESKGCRYH